MGEPWPAWEARMDVLERPGAVASRNCCGWLVPRGCETIVSRSTAGTTHTLRVEEHACRSWRCGEPGRTESWITKVLIRYNIPWKP